MIALRLIIGALLIALTLAYLRHHRKMKSKVVSQKAIGGFLIWQTVDRIVDYVVYPTVIFALGMWWGGLTMIVFTLIGNTIYIHVNNITESDWSGMSWLNRLRDAKTFIWINSYDHLLKKALHLPTRILRRAVICFCAFVRQLLRIRIGRFKLSNTVVFFMLSVWKDSFMTVNYFFHKDADLRNPKVVSIFLASHVVSNAAWLVTVGIGGAYLLRVLTQFHF